MSAGITEQGAGAGMSTTTETTLVQLNESQADGWLARWQDYGYALSIQNNGSEWTGTFDVMAKALIDDLLSDGEPVKMALLHGPVDTWDTFTVITATVTGHQRVPMGDHKADVITFADGSHAVIEGLLAVFV
jgi:hypothetical protein